MKCTSPGLSVSVGFHSLISAVTEAPHLELMSKVTQRRSSGLAMISLIALVAEWFSPQKSSTMVVVFFNINLPSVSECNLSVAAKARATSHAP